MTLGRLLDVLPRAGTKAVEPGAALSVTNSTINGTVTATNPAAITFCGATEHGALSVTGPTQGPVILGGTLANGFGYDSLALAGCVLGALGGACLALIALLRPIPPENP